MFQVLIFKDFFHGSNSLDINYALHPSCHLNIFEWLSYFLRSYAVTESVVNKYQRSEQKDKE